MNEQTKSIKESMIKLLIKNPDWEAEEIYEAFCWSESLGRSISEQACKEMFKMTTDEMFDLAIETYNERESQRGE